MTSEMSTLMEFDKYSLQKPPLLLLPPELLLILHLLGRLFKSYSTF